MLYLLYNPLSNNKKTSDNLKRISKDVNFRFPEIPNIVTKDITQIKNLKEYFQQLNYEDIIIIAGGDGTLSKFCNEIMDYKIIQKIFYYPCGSGNDFYKDVIKESKEKCSFIQINKYLNKLPYVIVNDKKYFFINGVGFGIDGYACEEGDKIRSNSNKKVNYTLIALKGLFGGYKIVNAKVTIDGVCNTYKKVWLAPSMLGSYYGGGIKIAPDQNRINKDFTLTNVIAHNLSILKIIRIFPTIYKGTHKKFTKNVVITTGHQITVEFDQPRALQIDGETISGVKKYTVIYE